MSQITVRRLTVRRLSDDGPNYQLRDSDSGECVVACTNWLNVAGVPFAFGADSPEGPGASGGAEVEFGGEQHARIELANVQDSDRSSPVAAGAYITFAHTDEVQL